MKYFMSILFAFALFGTVFGQKVEIPKESQPSRWRVGGGLGISLGNHNSGIYIAPSLGCMITNKLEAGVTLGYTHNKYDDYKFDMFSGGVFANYHIIPELFARTHYEYLTGKRKNNTYSDTFNEDALWIGAGYQNQGRVRFQAGIMYDVLYDEDSSIYSSPWRPFGGVSISF